MVSRKLCEHLVKLVYGSNLLRRGTLRYSARTKGRIELASEPRILLLEQRILRLKCSRPSERHFEEKYGVTQCIVQWRSLQLLLHQRPPIGGFQHCAEHCQRLRPVS